MSVNLPIPAFNVVQGDNPIGPLNCPAGLHQMKIVLDCAALVGDINVSIEIAIDGITFAPFCSAITTFPQSNKFGSVTSITLIGDLGSSDLGSGLQPVLTTNTTKIRANINSSAAFHSNGGTLSAA